MKFSEFMKQHHDPRTLAQWIAFIESGVNCDHMMIGSDVARQLMLHIVRDRKRYQELWPDMWLDIKTSKLIEIRIDGRNASISIEDQLD